MKEREENEMKERNENDSGGEPVTELIGFVVGITREGGGERRVVGGGEHRVRCQQGGREWIQMLGGGGNGRGWCWS